MLPKVNGFLCFRTSRRLCYKSKSGIHYKSTVRCYIRHNRHPRTKSIWGKYNTIQGCNIGEITLLQKIFLEVDTTVLQEISSSAAVSTEMEQKVENIVSAESPNFALSHTEAESFTKMVNTLSSTLQNNISASCAQDANVTNAFVCEGTTMKKAYIEQDNITTFLFDCTQNISSVVSAKTDLQNFLQAHAKAETKDIIVSILIVIAVIIVLLIIGALVLGFVKSRLTKPPPPQTMLRGATHNKT